jgi:hypothetical protein
MASEAGDAIAGAGMKLAAETCWGADRMPPKRATAMANFLIKAGSECRRR